jgi:hypothetical protein
LEVPQAVRGASALSPSGVKERAATALYGVGQWGDGRQGRLKVRMKGRASYENLFSYIVRLLTLEKLDLILTWLFGL